MSLGEISKMLKKDFKSFIYIEDVDQTKIDKSFTKVAQGVFFYNQNSQLYCLKISNFSKKKKEENGMGRC